MRRQLRIPVAVLILSVAMSMSASAAPRRSDEGISFITRVIRQIKHILLPGATEDVTFPKP